MKNKKIILILIILLIALAIAITVIMINIKGKTEEQEEEEYAPNGLDSEYNDVEEDVSRTMRYILSKCINENIQQDYYYIEEIYRVNKEEGEVYFTYGIQGNEDKYYIVYLDYNNNTYEIETTEKNEYNKIKKGNGYKKYQTTKEIAKNNNNTFEVIDMTDKKIAELYFDIIKNLIKYNPEILYNLLDAEYRDSKFTNLETFKQFINENKEIFENMKIKKYVANQKNDYMQYICTGETGENYIINEISSTDYSIILDNFTN